MSDVQAPSSKTGDEALGKDSWRPYHFAMRPAKKTKSAIKKLSPADVKKLLNWIDKRLDDELDFTEEVKPDVKREKKTPPPGASVK